MIEQIIEISSNNKHLSKNRGFLQISESGNILGKIPLDDILGIIITGFGCTHSSNLITACAEMGISFVVCGTNYNPVSYMLPVSINSYQSERFRIQIATKETTKNQIWKQIVKSKILSQSWALKICNKDGYEIIKNLARNVQSGDTSNLEGQAASKYWRLLMGDDFRRDKNAQNINSILNYGYTILRSTVARAVCGTGLHPTIGVHHKNKSNPMCLVDDIMEPFRPVIDVIAYKLMEQNQYEINNYTKQVLSNITVMDFTTEKGTAPLFKICTSYTKNILDYMNGEKNKILSPIMPDELAINSVFINVD